MEPVKGVPADFDRVLAFIAKGQGQKTIPDELWQPPGQAPL